MSINLLDMLKDQVTGPLAKQASGFLGESEENVTSGLGNIFPTLLGSVINKSTEPEGALGLMDMISGLNMDKLSDIGGLFGAGGNSVNGLLNSGGGLIENLLGDKMGGIIELISNRSGLKSGSTSSLLKMAAPFLMGIIGKQIKGKGISSLTDLLLGQKDHVKAAMPSGLGNLLGLAGMTQNFTGAITGATASATSSASNAFKGATDFAGSTASKTTEAASAAASTGMSWLKWAAPLLIVGALLLWGINAGWFGGSAKDAISNVSDGVENVANKAGETATGAVDAVGDATSGTVGAVSDLAVSAFATIDEAAKSTLDKISFTANSAGSQMMEYINGGFKGDGKVTFNNLNFETGSAKITAESAGEIDNLAAILKAYPKVNIQIDGYTDSKGDASKNKTLSEARALAVKARLVGQGIEGERLATAGYGADNPVATNDTAEGRAQNRRIEVTIK